MSGDDQGLIKLLKKRWPKREVKMVKKAFAALGLPLPHKNEYTYGLDGILVFLNRAGSVLRLDLMAKTSENRFKHTCILQPVGRRKRGKVLFEIYPGVICPISTNSVKQLRGMLIKDGFYFEDSHHMNAGYLPGSGDRFPVVLDPGAVQKLRDYSRRNTGINPIDLPPDAKGAQKRLYGGLKDAFATAWPKDQEWAKPRRMEKFWELCSAEKKKGILTAHWLSDQYRADSGYSVDCDYKNIIKGSRAYERRWNFPANG